MAGYDDFSSVFGGAPSAAMPPPDASGYDAFSSPIAAVSAGDAEFNSKPHVPTYAPDGSGGEININRDAQTRAHIDAMEKAADRAKAEVQARFDATRTIPARIRDTATFAASVPVRAATGGKYGVGDVFGLANENAGANARQSEQDFARANQTGLEYAAAAGDVMAGVPMLSTMGAIPGQMLNTMGAATRQLPGEMRRVLTDSSGAAKIPGKAPPQPMRGTEFLEKYVRADPTIMDRIPYLKDKPLGDEFVFPEIREGKVVGVTSLEQSPHDPDVMWSMYTSVDPAYQKQGIGKSLVQQKLDFVDAQGKALKISDYTGEGERHLAKYYRGRANVFHDGDLDFQGQPLIRDGKVVGTTGDASVDRALTGGRGDIEQIISNRLLSRSRMQSMGMDDPGADAFVQKLRAIQGDITRAGGNYRVGEYTPKAPGGGSGVHGMNSGPNPATGPFVPPSGSAGGSGMPPPPPATPPIAPAPTPASLAAAGRLPTKAELLAAGERQGYQVPRMLSGMESERDTAAALAGIPHVGTPVKLAYDRGLQAMDIARNAAMDTLGAPGAERAGAGAKQSVMDWIRKASDEHLEGLYKTVYAGASPDVTRPLMATAGVAQKLLAEMKASTATTAAPAVKMIEEALARPGGLTAQGLADLRTAIGQKIDAAKIVPDASVAAYKRLYPALTSDLRATLQKAGGDKALKAWDTANREAKIVAGKRSRLAQVIGAREESLSAEKVLERINSLADAKGGNARNLRLIRETIGDVQWGNVGAELASRLGTNPKDGLFSADRYLTAYGKMSEEGRLHIFGAAKPALDDIAVISKRISDLGSRFNRSNTGKVNAMLKVLTDPTAMLGMGASVVFNPLALPMVVGQAAIKGGGMAMGRRMAWSLARPEAARKASSMLRAYYGAERAAQAGLGAVAAHEQALANSVKAFSIEVAKQTGGNAAQIEAEIAKRIADIRAGKTD